MSNICGICKEITEVRYISLYITGEGLNMCHSCEMQIVTFIRDLANLAGRSRKMGYQIAKQREKEGD